MHEKDKAHEAEGFNRLMSEFLSAVQSAEQEPDFTAYLMMPRYRRDQMRKMAYFVHQRISFMLAAKGIHRSLDDRMTRISFGEKLNGPVDE